MSADVWAVCGRALQNENSLRQGPCLIPSVLEATCCGIGKYWMHAHKPITWEDFPLKRLFIPLDVYGVSPLAERTAL